MGTSIAVNRSNFATDVLDKSHEKPVLLDFFATWCGPCQMLKPMLERLAQEYDFVLAKVDIDANPELAGEYGVEGVPDVRVVQNGEVHNAFVGVLPEPELRNLMTQLNLTSTIDQELDAIAATAQGEDVEATLQQLKALVKRHPNNSQLALNAARICMQIERLDEADQILDTISEYDREFYPYAKQFKALNLFKRAVNEPSGDYPLDATYREAAQAALGQDFETALMLLLEIVTRDRAYKNDAGRNGMLAIFDLLGDDHRVTRHYRKALTSALYA